MSLAKILSFNSNLFIPLCIALLAAAVPVTASAVQVDDLYEVILPVADESNEVRNAAMDDGLAEVMVRISGDSKLLQKLAPPPAAAYVKQYRYEALEPAISGAPKTPDTTSDKQIRLQYNGTRIMDYLRNNGLAIWGDHRPVGVVWLAIRDGRNQYLLKASDRSRLKAHAEMIFRLRGVPVIWPAYDKQDKAILKFADVWAGFSEPLQAASTRYSNGPILAGSMAWNGKEWSSDWTLIDQRFSQRWSARGVDYEQVLSDAINQLSDGMGQHYAVLESKDSTADTRVVLDIENVNSLTGFVRLKKYLASLQAVQSVQIARVGGDNAVFNLSLRSRVEDFLNLLSSSSRLKAIKKAVAPVPINQADTVNKATPANTPGAENLANTTAGIAVNTAPVPTMMVQNLYHYRLVN
jgi:hypothetical protein